MVAIQKSAFVWRQYTENNLKVIRKHVCSLCSKGSEKLMLMSLHTQAVTYRKKGKEDDESMQ